MKKKSTTLKPKITPKKKPHHKELVLRLIQVCGKINSKNESKIQSYLEEFDAVLHDIEVIVRLEKPRALPEYDTSIPGGIVL
jgi:hypothetical protein